MGPIFSVTSMRPSGRKAIRQGSSKVVVVVILKGTVGSGFCSPTLTWAQAAARVRSSAAFANFIVISPYLIIWASDWTGPCRRHARRSGSCRDKLPELAWLSSNSRGLPQLFQLLQDIVHSFDFRRELDVKHQFRRT